MNLSWFASMKRNTPSFFELDAPGLLDRWGDYGSILLNGMYHEQTQILDRTGPFVPPFSFPAFCGVVIVTSEARQKLEASSMSGVGEFRPVVLGKVVLVDWQQWDKNRALGRAQLPFNCGPEQYILHQPHDAATASQIEPLWTWHPLRIGKVLRAKGVMRLEGIIGKHDVFRLCDDGWRKIIVSENGKRCMKDIFGDWVGFERIEREILS